MRFQMEVDDAFLKALDDWRRQQPDLPSRSESVRRFVEAGSPATLPPVMAKRGEFVSYRDKVTEEEFAEALATAPGEYYGAVHELMHKWVRDFFLESEDVRRDMERIYRQVYGDFYDDFIAYLKAMVVTGADGWEDDDGAEFLVRDIFERNILPELKKAARKAAKAKAAVPAVPPLPETAEGLLALRKVKVNAKGAAKAVADAKAEREASAAEAKAGRHKPGRA